MEQLTTPTIAPETAHLLNALRLLEQVGCEIYDAFEPQGEDMANAQMDVFCKDTDKIRETLDEWLLERVRDWVTSIERQATI